MWNDLAFYVTYASAVGFAGCIGWWMHGRMSPLSSPPPLDTTREGQLAELTRIGEKLITGFTVDGEEFDRDVMRALFLLQIQARITHREKERERKQMLDSANAPY